MEGKHPSKCSVAFRVGSRLKVESEEVWRSGDLLGMNRVPHGNGGCSGMCAAGGPTHCWVDVRGERQQPSEGEGAGWVGRPSVGLALRSDSWSHSSPLPLWPPGDAVARASATCLTSRPVQTLATPGGAACCGCRRQLGNSLLIATVQETVVSLSKGSG